MSAAPPRSPFRESEIRGALIQEFPGTISFKNWPFLVLLGIIGGLIALVTHSAVGILVGIMVPGLPAGWVVLAGYVANLFVARPVALYEGGWEVSLRGTRVFWPFETLTLEADELFEMAGLTNRAIRLAKPNVRPRLVVQSGIQGLGAVEMTVARVHAVP